MISDDKIHEAVVIGAGLAGLTTAFMLKKRGLDPLLLEKDTQVGGSWSRRHLRLTLNTHRDLSCLPGLKYPPGTGAFPKRNAVVSHLQEFARRHAFKIDYGCEVISVTKSEQHFSIKTDLGEILANNVVMATGRDVRTVLPAWKGLELYRGEVIHAADFEDAREYASRSILVVGGGNSGFDILNHLSRVQTGPVWFSMRRGPSILPRRLGRFAIHRLSPIMAWLPTVVVDHLIAWTQYLAFGRLRTLGFPPGRADAATRLANEHVAIPVDDGTVAAIRKGAVTVVPEVVEFRVDAVMLADGSEVNPDIVIAAAGYGSSLPSLLRSLPVLDGNGYPLQNQSVKAQGIAGLWFTGMTPTLTSYFMQTRLEALDIADGIAASCHRSNANLR
jgi:cation diffusion facilitator CzcD-associated flavoprotein CzcO